MMSLALGPRERLIQSQRTTSVQGSGAFDPRRFFLVFDPAPAKRNFDDSAAQSGRGPCLHTQKALRAAVYARVSTTDQTAENQLL
jgi:hypothetical protein